MVKNHMFYLTFMQLRSCIPERDSSVPAFNADTEAFLNYKRLILRMRLKCLFAQHTVTNFTGWMFLNKTFKKYFLFSIKCL